MKASLYISFTFLLYSTIFFAQTNNLLKFKKDTQQLYFFQKENQSDSIFKNKNDLFYLVIPANYKSNINILLDNGQLIETNNDSIFKLIYIGGFKYESFFNSIDKINQNTLQPKPFEYKILINGVSYLEKNRIKIQIINKKEDVIILENNFIYFNYQ